MPNFGGLHTSLSGAGLFPKDEIKAWVGDHRPRYTAQGPRNIN